MRDAIQNLIWVYNSFDSKRPTRIEMTPDVHRRIQAESDCGYIPASKNIDETCMGLKIEVTPMNDATMIRIKGDDA